MSEPGEYDEGYCAGRNDAQAEIAALAADRDQISLTLDVAKADRDKWFNRARDAERRPNLGIATNRELREELRIRTLMEHTADDYRTWDGPRSDMETGVERGT